MIFFRSTLAKAALAAALLALPLAVCAAPDPAAAPPTQAGTEPAPAAPPPRAENGPAAAPAPAASVPQAQTQPSAPITMPTAAGPSAGNLLQTILALLFVLAVLAALAWFMKRYGPKAGGGTANLRIVGALNLGGRERIMVIEVGEQWIVVGASPGRINALATLPKQAGVEPSALLAGQVPSATGFAHWMKQTIDKRNAK